ncbi:MAG: hypothetical protein EU539_11650 [Promethearchaeota archaeon]|nr:MAG: hypothetical protein EU539_11650 [Candidatus Lokiarchaeota archaeon]
MQLEPVEVLQVTFSMIFVIISFILGILLISKYFKYKRLNLLLVGVTWIGITTPWLSGTISFPMMVFLGTSLSVEIRFIIGIAIVPLVLLIWLFVFTDLVYTEKRKVILAIYGLIVAIFEIIFFIFLFTDTALIGTYTGPFKVDWTPFIEFSTLFFIITALITGIKFSLESMKSEDPEVKLKGKILMAAFISFVAGAFLDSIIPISPVVVVFTRLILISSAIEFYLGFFLPEPLKKILVKEKTSEI